MNKIFLNLLLLLSGVWFLVSCSSSTREFSVTKEGDIWFRNRGIKLRIEPGMAISVFYHDTGMPLNVTDRDGKAMPAHHIVVSGEEITGFSIDYKNLQTESIESDFGKGTRLSVKGEAALTDGTPLEKTLWVEIYPDYPDVAVLYTSYRNLGSSHITVNRYVSNHFCLDASRSDPQLNPYDFWSFQGASLSWGADYEIRLKEGFRQENWMGVQPRTQTGGGIPLVDIWNKNTGLAIAHLEDKPQLVSFPVVVAEDKRVEISIKRDLKVNLAPGEGFQTMKTAVIAHTLDYFAPLQTFSSLMADQGILQEKPSEETHKVFWCGWGYLTDFTLEDIYGTLPKLKELGIEWVVIDDRWWDRYGDWNLRDFTFPGGEKQMKQFVDSLHKQGFKVKIWWAPTPVQPDEIPSWRGSYDPGMARVAIEHPEWLIMDEDGSYPRDNRDMYQFCPSVPEVQEYMRELTLRFIQDWDFDGHKLDAYYVVPPCYNPAHNHKSPEESYQDLPQLLRIIYETSKSVKPWSVTELCNCGTTQDFYQSVYSDQPVVSDPITFKQVRRRIKSMKALWGPDAPVYADHVEHVEVERNRQDRSKSRLGQDFASQLGPGGVIGTKFTWPGGPENVHLTPEREKHWQKWIGLHNEKMLSKGEYLNLYDIVYDLPETHVILKDGRFHYAFYADEWTGQVELRGLDNRSYRVHDYVNQIDLGTVKGPVGKMEVTFREHLLVECIPAD